ncbi:hypothetical protein CEE60_19445 [Stenotrophomonas maltophilia]|uniref:Uncharacterized protein n=1 Tax=Stenotrophomonas maltophilia TaxID=40324 RepID=A0A246HIG6_STEMA|nr:hypothetical protein CEE60_19445 [Stenotrophomonas maltophilia]
MFSKGLREFDKSHFLGLFKCELDEDQLRSIFSDGPTGTELHRRTKEVLDASVLDDYLYFQPKSPDDRSVLVSAAKAWLQELASFCSDRGNAKLQGIAEGARIAIRDRQLFQLPKDPDTPAGWMLAFIGDEVDFALGDVDPVMEALMEALYGIAGDYYLCWYVIEPMIELPLTFAPYVSIWRNGARPVLAEDELVLLVEVDG